MSVRALQHVWLLMVLAGLASVGGCASISETISSQAGGLPGVGLPANAPERPATPLAYPAVHDMPPQRGVALLNEVEQQKVEDDLIAARERQQETAGVPRTASTVRKRAAPAPVPRAIPAASNRTIY